MSYVVTWWEGHVRASKEHKTAEFAEGAALSLRLRSDTYVDRSLMPIRVMPKSLYERMRMLEKKGDQTTCRHGLLRLCVPCLSRV